MLEITSESNPRYKSWLKSLESRGIKKQGEAILAGKKFLTEILAEHPERVHAAICREESEIELYYPTGFDIDLQIYTMPNELFAKLDIYGTNAPLLVISAPPLPLWDEQLEQGITLFLPFQNPINLGTIIRSAAALNANVVVLQEAANIYHPKTLRAAGPNIFKANIKQGPALADLAQYINLPLFSLGLNGENLFQFQFPETFGLVAGMEGPGLEESWPQKNMLTIPMQAGVDSLNAGAAVDMALGVILSKMT